METILAFSDIFLNYQDDQRSTLESFDNSCSLLHENFKVLLFSDTFMLVRVFLLSDETLMLLSETDRNCDLDCACVLTSSCDLIHEKIFFKLYCSSLKEKI